MQDVEDIVAGHGARAGVEREEVVEGRHRVDE